MLVTPEQINEKYPYGTRLVRKKHLSNKEDVAYVVTHSAGYDIVVKLSPVFPYEAGKDEHFFVHVSNLVKWHHAKEGIQLELYK